jgi:hypothetical protein
MENRKWKMKEAITPKKIRLKCSSGKSEMRIAPLTPLQTKACEMPHE